jgi:hypothetical protein
MEGFGHAQNGRVNGNDWFIFDSYKKKHLIGGNFEWFCLG